jgi:glycosyltransferase involved in cell wall biosynthesis
MSTRDEALTRGIIPAERLSVVYNGLRPDFPGSSNDLIEGKIDTLLGIKTGDVVDILHVGDPLLPRKQIDFLLRLFAQLRASYRGTLRLLRVGGPFTDAQQHSARLLGISDSIINLPFLSPPELASLYSRASLMLLPSNAEGFGLPVIEALACGTPVLASDLPVLREVGGNAASYAPTGDLQAWVVRTNELLNEMLNSPFDWQNRRARSRERSTEFTWKSAADKIAETYIEVLNRSRKR